MTTGRWERVCRTEDVPLLEGRRVVVDGHYIAVFNTEEGFFATGDVCPHLGGPLSDGDIAATTVSCPLHMRKIDLTTGEVKNDDLPCVETFSVRLEDGYVLLDVSALYERTRDEGRCAATSDEAREEVA